MSQHPRSSVSRLVFFGRFSSFSRLTRFRSLSMLTMLTVIAMVAACGAAGPPSDPMDIAGRTTEIHPGDAGSPHVMTEWVIDEANISITYGRPYLKGRVIGETVEPMVGRVWRLGADEATTLETDAGLMIGDTPIAAGEYTLFVLTTLTTLTTEDAWQLIVNSQTGPWGLDYDESQDLARIDMDLAVLPQPVDQLLISIEGGRLKVEWGTASASVPLTVQ